MAEAYPQPEMKGGVIAYLQLDGAMKAAEFYVKAFGAEIAFAQPVDDKGRTMHVHLYINNGSLMLSDAYPEHGHALQTPQGFTLHQKIDGDIDAVFNRAVEAGCTVLLPIQDMFWGDRYGQLKDPYGVSWSFGKPQS